MTTGELDVFMLGTMILCAVMAVVNLTRHAKRGVAAYVLSTSFLVMGGTIYLYRSGASPNIVKGGCVVLIALLVVDFFLRAGNPPAGKKR